MICIKATFDKRVPLLNASVRFVKQNKDSPLSPARDGDRFAVVICFNQSLQDSKVIQAKKWLRQAQHLCVEKGGSYYLPYQHVSSLNDFERSYPGAPEAQAYKASIDPNQTFTSAFHEKYMVPTHDKPINQSIDYVRQVMKNPEWRQAFKGFLTHVLQRVDSYKLYTLLDDVMTYNDSHEEIYEELCKRLPEIMPSGIVDLSHQLYSLADIQKDLGQQAEHLIPKDKVLNGIVEVGSPGRYIGGFKRTHKVEGKTYALTESVPSTLDGLINGHSFHPFDEHVLFDYNNPTLQSIPDKSADVITCYVGLHHFSPEGLDTFLTEVKRVLRDGGQFLLVDHAVGDESSMSMAMAHMAHFIFNAVNGAPLQEEMNEIRDFKPLSFWQEKLKAHGLDNVTIDESLMRSGDPTRNCMITAVNRAPLMQASVDGQSLNQALQAKLAARGERARAARAKQAHMPSTTASLQPFSFLNGQEASSEGQTKDKRVEPLKAQSGSQPDRTPTFFPNGRQKNAATAPKDLLQQQLVDELKGKLVNKNKQKAPESQSAAFKK